MRQYSWSVMYSLILTFGIFFNYSPTILFAQSTFDLKLPIISDKSSEDNTKSSKKIDWAKDKANYTLVGYGNEINFSTNNHLETSLIRNKTKNTNGAPEAKISVVGKSIVDNKINVQAGEVVQFIGTESTDPDGDPLTYRWIFGDGAVSNEADPSHMYEESGSYTVMLTVDDEKWEQYNSNPFVIQLQQPNITDRGGIIVCDLDGDGLFDYLVSTKDDPLQSQTSRATIGAYAHNGFLLWVKNVDLRINGNSENYGLPGWHGPGLTAADIDGDGQTEVLHLNTQNLVVIRDGKTGEIERTISVPMTFGGASRWGLIQIVNLRGAGDKDLILQADPNYFGSQQNMFPWLKAISLETGETLWSRSDYWGQRHGGFRTADIDGDGLDEVAGAVLIDNNGNRMNSWNYRSIIGHLDAVQIADVKPDVPGLEVILLEESWSGDDREAIVNPNQVFVYASRNGDEPQNCAVGNFDPNRQGLEIWCRSRYNTDQRPWVLNASGNVIAEWIMNEKKPAGWSPSGIEVIFPIDWNGGEKQFIAAKERHTNGKIAVIDAMTGNFVRWWDEQTDRIFVADVSGDYREEIIVLNSSAGEIRIYWNDASNPNPTKQRYWHKNYYKRQKDNHNYYSP